MAKLSIEELRKGLEEYFGVMDRGSDYEIQVTGSDANYVVIRIMAQYMFYSTDVHFLNEFIHEAGYSFYITAISDVAVINITRDL